MSEIAETSVNDGLFPGIEHPDNPEYFLFPIADRDRVDFTNGELPSMTKKVDDLAYDLEVAILALRHSAKNLLGEASSREAHPASRIRNQKIFVR